MIPAIVLAAGASRRMGRSKALLPVGGQGEVFVTRLLTTLRDGGAGDLLVVLGADAQEVRARVDACPVPARLVHNPDFERGQLSSLLAALDVVDRPGVRALMVIPVDMPLVTARTVRAVLDTYCHHEDAWVVRPTMGTRHGHPVIFDRAVFPWLRRADPGVGARAVVAALGRRVIDVPLQEPDEGAFVDIDTPEDYRRYIGHELP